jgi:hypothetical protein
MGPYGHLHKNGCNWQLVTLLSCNGLQRHFVSSFRFTPVEWPCRRPQKRKMLPVLPVLPVTFFSRAIAVAATADVFINNAQKTRYTRYIVDGQRLNPLQMPLQGRYTPATFHKLLTISNLKKSNQSLPVSKLRVERWVMLAFKPRKLADRFAVGDWANFKNSSLNTWGQYENGIFKTRFYIFFTNI